MSPLKTILCVDDDPLARLIIKKSLDMIGAYNSVEAKSGQDCLDYVSENKVDLIILDYHLGDMDGQDVCKKITSMGVNSDIPVIISSVIDSYVIKARCDYPHLVKIVQKPYYIDSFYKDIEEILNA